MKRIIIIGASSGIGLGVARRFATMGWKVGVAARRSSPLEALSVEFPDKIEWTALDVTSHEAPAALETLIVKLGGVDVLLYAAGCGWYNPDADLTDDLHTADVNVIGFTRIIDTIFSYFSANNGGHIAAITSVAGVKGLGISTAYSASKRFQWNYLEGLDQLARTKGINIRFTDIRPGFVSTDLLSRGPARLPMTMPIDKAVNLVTEAIIKRHRIAVIDIRWRIIYWLWSCLPGIIWRRFKLRLK
ncbi:MAG: SDR family NAD(P)-dependent oxidoreductase [Odoribacter sp.]|nr:SDR family NAD(P)-dependent oxidoreductase [Odoribacter sp.]